MPLIVIDSDDDSDSVRDMSVHSSASRYVTNTISWNHFVQQYAKNKTNSIQLDRDKSNRKLFCSNVSWMFPVNAVENAYLMTHKSSHQTYCDQLYAKENYSICCRHLKRFKHLKFKVLYMNLCLIWKMKFLWNVRQMIYRLKCRRYVILVVLIVSFPTNNF